MTQKADFAPRLHLRELDRCNAVGCDKPCEVEVLNQWNALLGRYCQKHGAKKVKDAG